MENIFDALCSVLGEAPNKMIFLSEEGGEFFALLSATSANLVLSWRL
jgi:hypothetical protein